MATTPRFDENASSNSLRLRSSKWTRFEELRQRIIANAPRLVPTVFAPQLSNTCGILMYHRIADRIAGFPFPTSNVTPKRLRMQLAGLLQHGYSAWPLRRLLEYQVERRTIPNRVFAVTFDDGYENNFLTARPILMELNIPATIFVCTAYLDQHQPFPFEDWQIPSFASVPTSHWRPLRTDQVATMTEDGLMDVGSHTHSHADFRNAPDRLKDDLGVSVDMLRTKFGISRPTFAFPFGKTHRGFAGPELASAAKEAGVICGLTSDNMLTRIDSDPFTWGRVAVTQADNAGTLRAKLDGRYALLRAHLKKALL